MHAERLVCLAVSKAKYDYTAFETVRHRRGVIYVKIILQMLAVCVCILAQRRPRLKMTT